MFGWINDCTECLVISKFGEDVWHQIKKKANCDVEDGGFIRYQYYPDSDTVTLVVAASEVLGISVDDVLFAFGDYFIDYVSDNGYSNILECLGSNLREWLSNLNSLHDHLQASYPKGFVAPVFWSEDDTEFDDTTVGAESNAILVHYYSQRGSLLVPLVVGCVKKLSKVYFDLDISMTQLQLQDEEKGVNHTSWRITTVNPEDSYKLRGRRRHQSKKRSSKKNSTSTTTSIAKEQEDDETIATTITPQKNFEPTFLEGQEQASNLRVEELVKRCVYNMDCELYYAFTREHYRYLVKYWQTNKIQDDKWCYQIWTLEDKVPETWVTMADLPPRLNPATIDPIQFGGKTPESGKYPPLSTMELQSFPPILRLVNVATNVSLDVNTTFSKEVMLSDVVHTSSTVVEAGVITFPDAKEQLENGTRDLEYVVWDVETDQAFHTFAIHDLKTTSTKQLFDLVPVTFDPVVIRVTCTDPIHVEDDEEDL